jgi:hypothetical protein
MSPEERLHRIAMPAKSNRYVLAAKTTLTPDIQALRDVLDQKPLTVQRLAPALADLSIKSVKLLKKTYRASHKQTSNNEIGKFAEALYGKIYELSRKKNFFSDKNEKLLGKAYVNITLLGIDLTDKIPDKELEPYLDVPNDEFVEAVRARAIQKLVPNSEKTKYLLDESKRVAHDAMRNAPEKDVVKTLVQQVASADNEGRAGDIARILCSRQVKLTDAQINKIKNKIGEVDEYILYLANKPEDFAVDMLSSSSDHARSKAVEFIPKNKLRELFDSKDVAVLSSISEHISSKDKPELLRRFLLSDIEVTADNRTDIYFLLENIFDAKLPKEAWASMTLAAAKLLFSDKVSSGSVTHSIVDNLPDSAMPEIYQALLKYDTKFKHVHKFVKRLTDEDQLDLWKRIRGKKFFELQDILKRLILEGPPEIAEAYAKDKNEFLRMVAAERLKKLKIEQKTKSLKDSGHSVPAVSSAQIEKLKAHLAELPEQDTYKWGFVQKHFNVPSMSKELKIAFEQLNQGGTVRRKDLLETISALAKESKQFDVGFDEYGYVQTIGMANVTQVIQLNVGDALRSDLRKRFGESEAAHFEAYIKDLAKAQVQHPVIPGKTAAWARVVMLAKPSVLLVEELQSDLFNPVFLDQWLHHRAGHFDDVKGGNPFRDNPEHKSSEDSEETAATIRQRQRATQEDEGGHEELAQELQERMQRPLPDHIKAMKSSVIKVLGFLRIGPQL